MSANTGLARKLARAHTLSTQVLDLARKGKRDERDLDCVVAVLQAAKNGHLHEVRVTPRLLEERLAVRRLLRARARIIDLAAQPYLPDGWSIRPEDQIASRVQGDTLEFDPAKVRLHLDPAQQGRTIVGTALKERLEGQPVLPAQVLDHLRAHTGLISESWKTDEAGNTRYIHFWGTVYRDRGGRLCVRCLCWSGGRWRWDYYYLTDDCGAQSPAALLAS